MAGEPRTTIGLKKSTKDKLNRNRAPGQCYDGFTCQLVDLWERANEGRLSYVGSSSEEVMPMGLQK